MTTDPTRMPVVHTIDGVDRVLVETDHTYAAASGALPFHVYRPPGDARPRGAVVFVTGFPDPGMRAFVGRPILEWTGFQDWARLVAASGLVAVLYENRDPADVHALIAHLRAHGDALGIDPARLGVWACSGHGPNALGVIAQDQVAAAALLYPFLLDLEGATAVADAARQFHCAVPPVTLDALPAAMPMLLVRAGRDVTPGLDATLGRFVEAARARGLALTLVEHAEAPHAFDLVDDSPRTHAVIDEVLAFLHKGLS